MAEHSRLKAEILALVAWADGDFDDTEREVFLEVLDRSPIDEDTRIELVDFLDHSPDRESTLARLVALPSADIVAALRTAYVLAHADGEFHPEEQRLFDDVAGRLGLDTDQRGLLDAYLEHALQTDRLERRVVTSMTASDSA